MLIIAGVELVIGLLCAYCGKDANGKPGPDGKIVGRNTYTQNHRDIAVGVSWFVARTLFIFVFMKWIKRFSRFSVASN